MAKRIDLPLQYEPAECGLVAITAITALLGCPVDLEEIKAKYGVTSRGLKLSQVVRILRDNHFDPCVALVKPSAVDSINLPCIALLKHGHYVVVQEIGRSGARIFDPACGWRQWSHRRFARSLAGPVIEVAWQGQSAPRRTSWIPLLKRYCVELARPRYLLSIGAVSILLQTVVLAAPLIAARVVDAAMSGLPRQVPLAIALYAIFQLLAIAFRSVTKRLAIKSSQRIERNVFDELIRRLFRKSVAYFSRNAPSTLANRIQNAGVLRTFLLRTVSGTLVQGLSAIVALVVLFSISPLLAVVIGTGLLCSFALNRRLLDQLASFQDERFLAFANQNRQLIEIARCAPAIKVNRAVPAMLRRFRRATALSTQADSVLERFKQRRQDLLGAVASMQQTLFLAVGVLLLVKGDISIGQFVAVGMLKEICLFGMQEVQDALSDLANVRVAMGRVHEIANAPATPQASLQFSHGQAGVDLEIRDLAFRYTAFDPFVFEHLSIHVRAGESVAITGPSGSGKSTLASVIVGSLEPTHGAVLIDGKVIDGATTETARSIIGTVMQFDHLIAGSIEENIRFFRKISDDEVREAARIACLDHFVNGLPMRYQTLVSDDHPAISGGQRQRILIARAIVGRPRLLIMDEATSFLDVETERRVSQEISRLQCTKVMFAHRMETISSADRVVRLQDSMEIAELVA